MEIDEEIVGVEELSETTVGGDAPAAYGETSLKATGLQQYGDTTLASPNQYDSVADRL